MRNYLLFLLLCLLPCLTEAQLLQKQNTYLDALELSARYKQFKGGKGDAYLLRQQSFEIFSKYGITEANISDNYFLQALVIEIPARSSPNSKTDTSNQPTVTFIPKAATSVSALNWQAAVINGLASFMAGRFKQEAMNMGLNLVFKQIKDSGTSEMIRSVFPRTYEQIATLYGQGQNSYYTADLLYLRQVIQRDYEELPDNLALHAGTIFPGLSKVPEATDMLMAGYHIFRYCREGQSLPQMLSQLAALAYRAPNENDFTQSGFSQKVARLFDIADMLSNALIDTAGSATPWVNPARLLSMKEEDFDKPELGFFYGLLTQQLMQIEEVKNVLQWDPNSKLMAGQINTVLTFLSKLNGLYTWSKEKSFNLASLDDQLFYLKSVQAAINDCFHNDLFRTSMNLQEEWLHLSGSYINIVEALLRKDYAKAIPLITIELGGYMTKKYPRTLAFVSQLATIESADDMEKLLSAYSLPIGSASIKRRSKTNLTFNGYVGFTVGTERAYGKGITQDKTNIGLSAPIGLSYTFRPNKKNTLTLFGSLLDLGSLVNARLGNDTSTYAGFRFSHFLSPGLGVFYNLKNIPVSFGLQFSYLPDYRTIQYETNGAVVTETNTNVARLNFSLLADIPFFTLYNKPMNE